MLNMDEVRERTEPFHDILVRSHQEAVGGWKKMATGERTKQFFLPLGDTARAEIIHDHVCHQVATRIEGTDGARITDDLDFFGILVGDDVLVRFKYQAADKPANSKSVQQELLAGQLYDTEMMKALSLDGKLPPLLVSCVYRLEGRVELSSVAIRMDCKALDPWLFPIWGDVDSAAEPLTFSNMPPAVPAVVKSTRKTKKAKDQSDQS